MNKYQKYEWIIIFLSFLIAYILEQTPWPKNYIYYRPTWYILILIYWIINLPKNINIGVCFTFGILIDFIKYSFIGIHALLYTIICYITLGIHNIIHKFTIWQQSFFIILLSILINYIIYLINFFFTLILFTMKYFIIPLVMQLFGHGFLRYYIK